MLLLTLPACFYMRQSWSFFRHLHEYKFVHQSLRCLVLSGRERRHLRYHADQLLGGVVVNFMVTNKQDLSFVQMVDLIKFILDFKTAPNYKLNTMSYKEFQLILTLVISFFFNIFFLMSHWALKTYLYLTPCFYWQI